MYEKFANWKNFPDESTPVTEAALNHFEQGITDVDVTRPGTPAEVELSSRLSGVSGAAEGLVQAERAARETAVTAEQSARVAAIEAETAARKTAIIGESDARIAALALKANADAVYTKAQVDAAVSPKANSVDVYSKAQSDTALGLKPNKTDVYTKAETFSRAETGTQITNSITASRPPLYGTGFPNGVVAAPVGTLYSDTAVTNGASLWQKISGTSTSGWIVAKMDTGWRNISDQLKNGWSADQVLVRRTERLVQYSFRSLDGSVATNDDLLEGIPMGYRGEVGSSGPWQHFPNPRGGYFIFKTTASRLALTDRKRYPDITYLELPAEAPPQSLWGTN